MSDPASRLEGKHALAMKVSGLGTGTVDYLGDTITLDARAAEIFDLAANTPLSRDALHDRIHPEDRPDIDHRVDQLLHPDYEDVIDVQHRIITNDGEVRWVNARKQVEFATPDKGGTPVPVSGLVAIMDITQHKRDQEQIEYLLRELNHRSKNMLTVVQGLARQTFNSGPPETFQDRFSRRIDGLVCNADALVRTTWSHANLDDLARAHLRAFTDFSDDRVTLDGPPVRLRPDAAQAIGMALHELSTNAVKYGALSNDTGTIRLTWQAPYGGDDQIELVWEESGGPPVTAPTRNGFGQTVMTDMVAATVDGTVEMDYPETGLIWRLRMPDSSLK
ncbi:sensor histidine kinase [Litoreibacter ponti]|nr:HWE histidine kinase domain-containing protein [Litoreibacter ponti]